jgi:hypothetical protein
MDDAIHLRPHMEKVPQRSICEIISKMVKMKKITWVLTPDPDWWQGQKLLGKWALHNFSLN